MKINFFDIDKFCEKLPEVTSNKLFDRKGFHKDGLFSQQIFGSSRNYSCACGVYYGKSRSGTKCVKCGVVVTHSNERRKKFAKIVLPVQVMNPVMYYIISKLGKANLKEIMDNMLLTDNMNSYHYNKKLKRYIPLGPNEELPEGSKLYKGLTGVTDIIKKYASKETSQGWKYIGKHIDKMFINNVMVIPPSFRPTSKNKDVQKRDKLNDFLISILNYSVIKKDELLQNSENEHIKEELTRNIQKHVFQYYEYILEKMSRKSGMIRESILGKRNDFSGRAVIAPDPTLNLDECSMPYLMLLELYKLEIANVLHDKGIKKTYNRAISLIDDCINTHNYALFNIVEEECNGKYIILNRQPTLHRMGVLAFKTKVNKDFVIKIHPMNCEPFNADFDGDQMATYRAMYPDAQKECEEKLSVIPNLISPSTGDLITGINQDIVLGLYLLTREGNTPAKEMYGVKTTEGRIKFLNCLPDSTKEEIKVVFQNKDTREAAEKIFNKSITKKDLKHILNDLARTVEPQELAKTLDKIKRLGFETTTMYGSTISLKGMNVSGAQKIANDIFDDVNLSIGEKVNKLKSDIVTNAVKANFGYSNFIESGSRGSWDQARQIILTRGYVSNYEGTIIDKPVKNNYVQGLTREEFFTSAYGTRKGLLDIALNTGVSGYLTRKAVYGTSNLELDESLDDCGTEDTYTIYVSSLKMAKSLVGRYYVKDGLTKEISYVEYQNIVGDTLNLRSPIYCNSLNICKKCYGRTAEILHSKYVGILASQALGEVGTQLVMRTFHTSGVAQTSGDEQEDIINDLTAVKNLLHCNNKMPFDKLILELYKVYSQHRNILMIHFECIVSQMMRSGNYRWRLLEDRHDVEPEMSSILSIPQKESWILALAFHKPKDSLIDGILNDSGENYGILGRIMTNQNI